LEKPRVTPGFVGNSAWSKAVVVRFFRGHWLISRLQGKARNRRGPTGTFFGRVARDKGEPKPTAINACRESDLLIVVLKHVEYGYPCECVELRGRPVRDHEGEKGEPYLRNGRLPTRNSNVCR